MPGASKKPVEVKAFADSFGKPVVCRTCGARIVWAEMVSGKRHPFNAEADGAPPVFLRTEVDLAQYGSRLVAHLSASDSHFATCKDAKDWKTKP